MLTGRFTFRRTFTGKIILQIEEEVRTVWPMSRKRAFRRRWRNATLMDLAATELRPLMDLRMKPPSYVVEVSPVPQASTTTEATPNVVPLTPRRPEA
jgi:hypothetical protein